MIYANFHRLELWKKLFVLWRFGHFDSIVNLYLCSLCGQGNSENEKCVFNWIFFRCFYRNDFAFASKERRSHAGAAVAANDIRLIFSYVLEKIQRLKMHIPFYVWFDICCCDSTSMRLNALMMHVVVSLAYVNEISDGKTFFLSIEPENRNYIFFLHFFSWFNVNWWRMLVALYTLQYLEVFRRLRKEIVCDK